MLVYIFKTTQAKSLKEQNHSMIAAHHSAKVPKSGKTNSHGSGACDSNTVLDELVTVLVNGALADPLHNQQ